MGAKKTTYKAIGAHLMNSIGTTILGQPQTIQIETEEGNIDIPRLQWVDKNRGQLLHLTKELGIPMPAILISFPEIEFEMLGAGLRKGETVVRVTSLFESYADSYFGSVDQDVALQYLEFNDLVFSTLEGLSGSAFSSLNRIRETEDEDHDFLIITHTDYKTTLTEASSMDKVSYITGNPNPIKTAPVPVEPLADEPNQFVNPLD
jgi:hypothetical protein